MGRCIIMNWKVFFKELFTNFWDVIGKPAIKLLIIGSIILVGALIISEYPKIMIYLDWVLVGMIGLVILALLVLLFVIIYQDVYRQAIKKAKKEKPKCHWTVRVPAASSQHSTVYDTGCGEMAMGIHEMCACGKEVVVDL